MDMFLLLFSLKVLLTDRRRFKRHPSICLSDITMVYTVVFSSRLFFSRLFNILKHLGNAIDGVKPHEHFPVSLNIFLKCSF